MIFLHICLFRNVMTASKSVKSGFAVRFLEVSKTGGHKKRKENYKWCEYESGATPKKK